MEFMVVGVDRQRAEEHGFEMGAVPPGDGSGPAEATTKLELNGMGPKILVSDRSTHDQPMLVWRFIVHGNTAVEFGVVPNDEALFDNPKALHRCVASSDGHLPIGFSSIVTVGSQLPLKVTMTKGTIVELVACKGSLSVLLRIPEDGKPLRWENTRTRPYDYK